MVIALMMSYQCNFHCEHCMVDSSHEYSMVSDKVIEAFYNIVEKNPVDWIYLVGGEVLLHIDIVEKIVKKVKTYCNKIMIFSNGTYLLNEEKVKRVEAMGVTIRISDDRFHRAQWSDKLEKKIYEKERFVVNPDDGTTDYVIPVGRAYEKFKGCKRIPDCSLYTGIYDERYLNHHRYMVMMNGDVNLYCETIEGALANVFDDEVSYELLIKREKILHNYLFDKILKTTADRYMTNLCNACQKYRVTETYIMYEDKIVAETKNFSER